MPSLFQQPLESQGDAVARCVSDLRGDTSSIRDAVGQQGSESSAPSQQNAALENIMR